MNKRIVKEFVLFLIVILIIVALGFIAISGLNGNSPEIVGWESYSVQAGDTLWTIMPDSKYDVRDLMDITKEHNNLESSKLYIGQIIEIPVVED